MRHEYDMPCTFSPLHSSNKCDKMHVTSHVQYHFTHLQQSSKLSSVLLVKDRLIGSLYDAVYGEVTLLERSSL